VKAPVKQVRCALYTRKSSEEGLDQAFNSLHAQREACEAYVKSQAGEGWKALGAAYDDGGFSGGSMERPALRRLLADIAAGKVDVVVVYKIDRLTRSLGDFARMVELFDDRKVSFVSVTQAFNTTTSMGRLTLNVLLSFAQFEREVTGERIRDKIAASKAKGMWMGGLPPLGYDLPTDPATRALVVNEAEARTVRLIFETYLELRSVHALARWLDGRAIRSKSLITRKGHQLGGQPFNRGALFHLLRNRLYRGMIVHHGKAHPGAHPAIVEETLFAAVQVALDDGARRHRQRPNRVAQAPLKGRIFDADAQPMSPVFCHGARGQVYRYYVSAPLQQGKTAPADGAIRRVPAAALEAMLANAMARLSPSCRAAGADALAAITRVEAHAQSVQLLAPISLMSAVRSRLGAKEEVAVDAADPSQLRLSLPVRMRMRGGRTWILGADETHPASKRDPVLISALRSAHALVATGSDGSPIVQAAPASPYERKLVRLAFLAPALQAAILDGRQPGGLTLERLIQAPPALLWDEQVREL